MAEWESTAKARGCGGEITQIQRYWLVNDGTHFFEAYNEADAEWLRNRLNQLERESDETPLDWEWLQQWATNEWPWRLWFGNSLYVDDARCRWRGLMWNVMDPKTRGEFFTLCRQLRVELKKRKADA